MRAIFQKLDFKVSEKSINDFMSQLDTKHDGVVEFEEFLACMQERFAQPLTFQEIEEVFNYMDKKDLGYITGEQIRVTFKLVGKELDPNELKCIMQKLDRSGKGKVSLEDFASFLK